jgi:hypothetical protein
MAKLIYAVIASLDGYIEDSQGGFDWAEPDEEVFRLLNELQRDDAPHQQPATSFPPAPTPFLWRHPL